MKKNEHLVAKVALGTYAFVLGTALVLNSWAEETSKPNELLIDKIEIDNFMLQKMIFIYNALQNGWDIKKNNEKYIFTKLHGQKKEVYLDSYLQQFLETNMNINNINSQNS